MISLQDLRERQEITTGEALIATYLLAEKYIGVLDNILKIKKQTEDNEEAFFRSRQNNTVLLETLKEILIDLEKDLKAIELKFGS